MNWKMRGLNTSCHKKIKKRKSPGTLEYWDMHRIFHVTDLLTAMDFLDWGNGIWGGYRVQTCINIKK